jgi:CheY-like chemotaxis protein
MATVLVVEDDKLSQRILSKMLAGGGHTALLAASTEEAWAALRQNVAIDLAILDNQLGRDWGWQFLEKVREDALFQDIPVVVYTAHTERNSILRYVELGVKSMLVKPYKAEVLFEEIAKAQKTGWPARLLERPEAACERLKLKEADYYSVLSAGASALEQSIANFRKLAEGRPDETKIREALQQLVSQSISLGMPMLRTLTESLARAMGSRNAKQIQNCLEGIESLRTLLRNRTLAYLGIENVPTAASSKPAATGASAGAAASTMPPFAGDPIELFRRRMAAAPLWKFDREFARLEAARLFPGDELSALLDEFLNHPVCQELLNTVRFLTGAAQSAAVEDLVGQIRKNKILERVFAEVGGRGDSGQSDDSGDENDAGGLDFEQIIHRIGIHKSVLLIAAYRLQISLRKPSSLDLSWLRTHTLLSLLLGYEIGRMLNSDDDLQVAAAGAVHDLGSWCFALSEPGIYAIALGRAHDGVSLDAAEKSLFGQNHGEVGATLLERAGFRLDFIQAATPADNEGWTSARDPLAVACVHLGSTLAWSAIARDEAHAAKLKARLLSSDDPVWQMVSASRADLPMDLPEFVDTLIAAAETCLAMIASISGDSTVAVR